MAAKGKKLVSFTKDQTQLAESGIYTHAQAAEPGAQGMTAGAFPRGGLSARDPRDELMAEKAQMVAASGGTGQTPLGLVTATTADFEYLRKKRETEALANLDAWIGKNFHKADPATRKWLQETFPEYYESRERIMTERAKFALRVKLIKLRGAKNEKDLMLMWGLQTGRIKLDRDWDVIGPYREAGESIDMAQERNRFKNGLFSFRRFLSEDERLNNAGGVDPALGVNVINPFAPVTTGQEGFQRGAGAFPGNVVPDQGRFPAFLRDVVQPYLA